MLKKISHPKVVEEGVKQIKEKIISGSLSINEKLPNENELAELLGISRATVREILTLLQAEGYTKTKRGQGTFVRDKKEFDYQKFTNWIEQNKFDINELIEARIVLEPTITSMACERISQKEIEELEHIHFYMVENAKLERFDHLVEGDEKFHTCILIACKNKFLQFMYSTMVTSLYEYRKNAFYPPANPNLVINAHKRILDAIKRRDIDESYKAMYKHLKESQKNIFDTAKKLK